MEAHVKRAHRTDPLKADNKSLVTEHIVAGSLSKSWSDIVMLMADVLDNAIKGEDIYITVGMTRNKDACLLTVTWDREKLVLSGMSLLDLAEQAHTLL
jgi:hypothetical protein